MSRAREGLGIVVALSVALSVPRTARADDAAPLQGAGAPPAEAKALASGPSAPSAAPSIGAAADDATTVAVSAGGLLTTGNSRTLALTGSGAFDTRFGANGLGASVLGNYGQGAPLGSPITASAENLQGRARYDRYFVEQASAFLIFTGRHDRFQGLDFRLNVDPGVKYLFVKSKPQALWGELGYDFQYDVRRDDARVVVDADKKPVLDASGAAVLLDKTRVDHSGRAFVGFRQAFNKEVTFSAGLEYLQSVVASTRWRLNFEALLAAKIAGGLAFGFGVTTRYDHDPLPQKTEIDSAANASLIYAFSDAPAKKEASCPCTAPPSAPPPCELPPPPEPDPAPAGAATTAPPAR